MVHSPGQYATEDECIRQCQPQQVPGFEIIGMENSCNGGYLSEGRANSPEECAHYCNKDLFGNCTHFMWDSSKERQNPQFVVDNNCILFTDIPYNCTEMIHTYPASLGSVMYRKSSIPNPSGLY
jgi:hypothetical protein